MASSSDIEAGKAYVRLAMKDNELHSGINKARKGLTDLGSSIASVGAGAAALGGAILAPLAGAISTFTQVGSALNDMSARTGVSASRLAELKFAAEQTGASAEDLEAGLRRMAKSGMDVQDFDRIAKQISAIKDPSERAAAAMEVFGKSGTKLLPMLAALDSLTGEAKTLGIAPSPEAVDAADRLGDAFDKVRATATAAAFNVGAALAPVMELAANQAATLVSSFSRWATQNAGLIKTIAAIGVGLVAVGTAAATFGGALIAIGASIAAVGTIGTAVGIALSIAFSPVTLTVLAIGAAIAALVYVWARFTKSGQEAIAGLQAKLKPLNDALSGVPPKFTSIGATARGAKGDVDGLADSMDGVATSAEAMAKSISQAEQKRASLVREFENPEERFQRKNQELTDARGQVNRNRVMNFIPEEQARREDAQLQEAQRRLHAQEAERRSRDTPKAPPPSLPKTYAMRALEADRQRQLAAEMGGRVIQRGQAAATQAMPEKSDRPDWAYDVVSRAESAKSVVGFSGAALAMGAQMGGTGPGQAQLKAAQAAITKHEKTNELLARIEKRIGPGMQLTD